MRKQLFMGLAVAALLVATIPGIAAGQSSSPSAVPVEEPVAPAASVGVAPSGYTWTLLAVPDGGQDTYPGESGVAADGTWSTIVIPDSSGKDRLVWYLGPTDTVVGQAKLSKSARANPRTLIRQGDQLLAVGSGMTWSSPDGVGWESAKNKLKGLWIGYSAGDGSRSVLLASESGKDGDFLLSTSDGETFTKAALEAPEGKEAIPDEVVLGPTGIVLVAGGDKDLAFGEGDDGTRYLWSSPDGVTFTPVTLPFEPMMGSKVRLAATPSGFLMFAWGEGGTPMTYTSPDGQTWTETSIRGGRSRLVALPSSSGGGLLMIGNGVLHTSPDGVTWTETPTPELEEVGQIFNAAALPDGRVVFAIDAVDDTAKYGYSHSVLVGTPQP